MRSQDVYVHADVHGAASVVIRNDAGVVTPYTLHPTTYTTAPYTLHATPCTLHPTPYTLHPTPCTLHPTPYTLHPTSFTLHHCTLHPARRRVRRHQKGRWCLPLEFSLGETSENSQFLANKALSISDFAKIGRNRQKSRPCSRGRARCRVRRYWKQRWCPQLSYRAVQGLGW